MSAPSLYVEFFRALRADSPPGKRAISISGVAVMCAVYTSSDGFLTTSGVSRAIGEPYTSTWNQCARLQRAGFLTLSGKRLGLSDAGRRAVGVLAGVARPVAWDDDLPPDVAD